MLIIGFYQKIYKEALITYKMLILLDLKGSLFG